MDCLSSGNKSLTLFPDPFPVWSGTQPSRGEIESICFLLLRHVFLIAAFFSSSHDPGGVTGHSTHRRAVQEICVLDPKKHVLTICATSGGIFAPGPILFVSQPQYAWQLSFARPANAKHILHKWNQKRSRVAIVSRNTHQRIGAAKRPDECYLWSSNWKTKGYSVAAINVLLPTHSNLFWLRRRIMVITGSHGDKWKQNNAVSVIP